MRAGLSFDRSLAELERAAADPSTPAAADALRRALASRSNHVVARAAAIAGEAGIEALVPELTEAFGRFLVDPVKTDPRCVAKVAVAAALYRLGGRHSDVFLQGIRYVQREPVARGLREDTAAPVRAACAMGLVRMAHPSALDELAGLLADPVPDARIAAARALAYRDRPDGAALLRLRVKVGDVPEVLGECWAALLQLQHADAVPFVAPYLEHEADAVADAAALALGGVRDGEALQALRQAVESTMDAGRWRTLLTAIALQRSEAALEFLVGLVSGEVQRLAVAAVLALGTYRHDAALRERVVGAVGDRPALLAALREAWG